MIQRPELPGAVGARLRDAIAQRALSVADVARQIGISVGTVRAALQGERRLQARTQDQIEDWLDGYRPRTRGSAQRKLDPRAMDRALVIDLFSGCGGLSLGFDRSFEGQAYETVLAMDIEEPMVRVFDANHRRPDDGGSRGRRVDLSEFEWEAEIQAFYLRHMGELRRDAGLIERLNGIGSLGLGAFLHAVQAHDAEYRRRLRSLREQDAYRTLVADVEKGTWAQTSVESFCARLRIPLVGHRWVEHPLVWSRQAEHGPSGETPAFAEVDDTMQRLAQDLWIREVARLDSRVAQAKQGSRLRAKLESFRACLGSPEFERLRDLWSAWWGGRLTLRAACFGPRSATRGFKALYAESYPVSVILGGPPCQGFSRIGRGKMNSLARSGAHVQNHSSAGDERNLLLHKYVQFVDALRPDLFLFENVSTFKAVINTDEGDFDAVSVLEGAFDAIGEESGGYGVACRTLRAEEHGVPQRRARFFMAGVRDELIGRRAAETLAADCLALERQSPHVPLAAALEGLPVPGYSEGRRRTSELATRLDLRGDDPGCDSARSRFVSWIGSDPTGAYQVVRGTDAHLARRSRADDAAWFQLMGPGARWMDYRCDHSPTLKALSSFLKAARRLVELGKDYTGSLPDDLSAALRRMEGRADEMAPAVNGSLSIRLLLESCAPLGSDGSHHLIRPVYLGKKGGEHGDWLRRLDPEQPSRTLVSHMAKDTYQFVHPTQPRMISVREAARIQTFPDDFLFGSVGIFYAFKMIGNAVPPLLSTQLAERAGTVLSQLRRARRADATTTQASMG